MSWCSIDPSPNSSFRAVKTFSLTASQNMLCQSIVWEAKAHLITFPQLLAWTFCFHLVHSFILLWNNIDGFLKTQALLNSVFWGSKSSNQFPFWSFCKLLYFNIKRILKPIYFHSPWAVFLLHFSQTKGIQCNLNCHSYLSTEFFSSILIWLAWLALKEKNFSNP